MKTENTLRMVRKSLLCFSMALGAGLLAACGNDSSGGGGASTFPAYFVDAPVEGAEYSGPTNPVKNTTRENGEFEASEGVFEFSVGATPLGSVRLNSDWENSQVTPADFIGVDSDPEVVAIARVLQGLDDNGMPEDGISISQSTRDGLVTVDLFANADVTAGLATNNAAFSITVGALTLTIRGEAAARDHLVATRQCLFSGGYMGDYRSTVNSVSGRSHFVFEPRSDDAISVRGVEIAISPADGSESVGNVNFGRLGAVGVIGNDFPINDNNNVLNRGVWTFVTPRLVDATWRTDDAVSPPNSGTLRLTRVAGDPTANRRVVGVEVEDGESVPVGIYALDYFADDSEFRGQYYDVETDRYSVLLLTVADGSAIDWPSAGSALTVTLTLSGMLGEGDTNATIEVTRDSESDSIGIFDGFTGDGNGLDGSWCDLVIAAVGSSGDVQSASVQSKTEVDWGVESLAMSHSRIGGDVSAHRLSRYLDSGFPANTAIDGVQILG